MGLQRNLLFMKRLLLLFFLTPGLLLAAAKINGAGASLPAPSYFGWAYEYQRSTGVRVNYQSIGSGGGIRQVAARTVDFGASDKPLDGTELKENKLYQFPALIGSIVLAYNMPGIADGALRLSNEAIEKIILGEAKFWDDPAIVKENKGMELPHKEITFIHRSDGSGTTYNFTHYLSGISEKWKNTAGVGKAVSWPCGLGGKGNEGVSNLIKHTPYSIGYVEYAYKEQNKFTAAAIPTADGEGWVTASTETVKNAAHHATWKRSEHFFQMLTLQPGSNTYPITVATFILLPEETVEANKVVTGFFDYSFDRGDPSAEKLGYLPLPEKVKEEIRIYWKERGIAPAK